MDLDDKYERAKKDMCAEATAKLNNVINIVNAIRELEQKTQQQTATQVQAKGTLETFADDLLLQAQTFQEHAVAEKLENESQKSQFDSKCGKQQKVLEQMFDEAAQEILVTKSLQNDQLKMIGEAAELVGENFEFNFDGAC